MFGQSGWRFFDYDHAIEAWALVARSNALAKIAQPEFQKKWLQCQGTWFVGVDVLENDPDGAVAGQEMAPGLRAAFADPLHPAQVSVIYPGYPKPRGGESEAAFQYRIKRDAAHVDGLLAVGPKKRRFLREPHRFVLGIPLTQCNDLASPMVVWEGSHFIMQRAFSRAFQDTDPRDWGNIDITEIYQTARKEAFETCRRVIVHADLGQAYAIHPLALHGVAPWGAGAVAPVDGRMIAYFRPQVSDWSQWLTL